MEPKKWIVKNIVNIEKALEKYAIFLLNRKIQIEPTKFLSLWNNASMRVVIDGGGNEWLKYANTHFKNLPVKKPDFLTGDMDSITKSSMKELEALGVKVVPTPDQDETDFTKSLMSMYGELQAKQIETAITITEFSGRIDQILSVINTLHKKDKFFKGIDVYLYSNDSLSWVLDPGSHSIIVPKDYVEQEKWCSFIPLDGECLVKTKGYKYNVDNEYVQFGGIISSSNTYSSDQLEMICARSLLVSFETNGSPEDVEKS